MKQQTKECKDSVTESSGIKFVGSIYDKSKQGYIGSTYRVDGVCPTLLTNSITNNKMYVLVVEEDDNNDRKYSKSTWVHR